MRRKLDELFREASQLTESEGAELAGLLENVEAAWAEEVELRIRQIDCGDVKPFRGSKPEPTSTLV